MGKYKYPVAVQKVLRAEQCPFNFFFGGEGGGAEDRK